MSFPSAALLYKIAAGLYAVAAPGHAFLGVDKVYPALKTASKDRKHAIGLRGAQNCWNYVVASLIIASLLNWQYSRTGGPVSREDIGIFWTIIGMHGINGFRYAQVGAYETLLPMWIAPILSIAAYYKV